jgi:dUTP pyrophosphatase
MGDCGNVCQSCNCEFDELEEVAVVGVPVIQGGVHLDDCDIPKKGSMDAAGFDLVAKHDFVLKPGKTTFVGTGVYLELPRGIRAMVYPRSGFSTKNDIIIPNSPGLIDSDYRGEVKVALHMLWSPRKMFASYKGKKGDRIAQLVFGLAFDWSPQLKTLNEIKNTDRGSGGFGSTGK